MTQPSRLLDEAGALHALRAGRRSYQDAYYAMYSSVYGGIVTDPALMLVPTDDHMVHRGDGVFSTLKCVRGNLYNLAAHLHRLAESAAGLAIPLPHPPEALADLVGATVRAGGRRDCAVRVLVSRGRGSFSVNPYDCARPELYIVAVRLKPPFMETHPDGATVRSSVFPVKNARLATIKSCNYLTNALMKKEAVDLGVDFVVGFDPQDNLAEGATENMGIVTVDGALYFPELDHILRGTTMMRCLELARQLVDAGELKAADLAPISRRAVAQAAELLIVGTTLNVTAVREFDGRPVGEGRPGPVYRALDRLLRHDMTANPSMLTPVFDAAP